VLDGGPNPLPLRGGGEARSMQPLPNYFGHLLKFSGGKSDLRFGEKI